MVNSGSPSHTCTACGTTFGAELFPDECPDCGTLYNDALVAEARPPAQRRCGICCLFGHNTSECHNPGVPARPYYPDNTRRRSDEFEIRATGHETRPNRIWTRSTLEAATHVADQAVERIGYARAEVFNTFGGHRSDPLHTASEAIK